MNIKDALRRLVDVTRLIDTHECGELYNELQSALYVAGEALHEADTNKPADTVDSPEFQALLPDDLPRFRRNEITAYIDAHVAKAVLAEREACAKEADDFAPFYDAAEEIADAIRARA